MQIADRKRLSQTSANRKSLPHDPTLLHHDHTLPRFRELHAFMPGFTWASWAKVGKYAGKGMRLDHWLVSSTLRAVVWECEPVGKTAAGVYAALVYVLTHVGVDRVLRLRPLSSAAGDEAERGY